MIRFFYTKRISIFILLLKCGRRNIGYGLGREKGEPKGEILQYDESGYMKMNDSIIFII